MSEPSNYRKSLAAVRRTVEQGSRRLPDRVRDLPALAVRTTVFGVGKLLDVSDRIRMEYDECRRTGVGPTVDRLRRGVPPPTDVPPHATDPQDTATDPQDTRRGRETAERPPSAAEPSPTAGPSPTAKPPGAELPVANYEQLSVASLRGRLRNLTISDLGTLLAYERTHADRPDVVKMYENRILKLEREQSA